MTVMLSEARALGIPMPAVTVTPNMAKVAARVRSGISPVMAKAAANVRRFTQERPWLGEKAAEAARLASSTVLRRLRRLADLMKWNADRTAERLLSAAMWMAEHVVADLAALLAALVPTWLRASRSTVAESPPRTSADVRALVAAPHGPTAALAAAA